MNLVFFGQVSSGKTSKINANLAKILSINIDILPTLNRENTK